MVVYELPTFSSVREDYLDDDAFKGLQNALIANPDAGVVIKGTGGLRKMRWADSKRNKGTRSGLRVIYYYKTRTSKSGCSPCTARMRRTISPPAQTKILKARLEQQIKARSLK